jgi:hypothetical protein
MRWARGWNGCGKPLEPAELRDLGHCLPVSWWGNMHRLNQAVSVLPGGVPSPSRRQPPILAAYEHFRLDRQGMLVSPRTLDY